MSQPNYGVPLERRATLRLRQPYKCFIPAELPLYDGKQAVCRPGESRQEKEAAGGEESECAQIELALE